MKANTTPVKLPLREKVAYGIGDVSNGLAVSSVAFWLLYYLTDVAGLPGTLAGIALMVGRAWDALIDPFIGWMSDKTESRWGKRRPFLLFGALTYSATFFSLWVMPEFETAQARFLYITVAFIAFNTALAFVFIPYTSLTAAMTSDYHERTSLTGYRMTFSQLSYLLGGALPPLLVGVIISEPGRAFFENAGIQTLFGSWAGTPRQAYFIIALGLSILMSLSLIICFAGTRERVAGANSSHVSANPFSYVPDLARIIKSNLAFRSSLMIKLLSTCATTLIGVNIPYYLSYVVGMPGQKTLVLTCLFTAAILTTPLWVMRARTHGKAATYRVAMYGYITVLGALVLLPAHPTSWIYPIAICAGVFHSAALMIPWSILPDVVEYDELLHGTRREGLLYGGSAFAYKFASAFAIFLVGAILDLVGYVPNQAQTPEAVLGIKLTIAFAPAILLGLSIWASFKYPLTPDKHRDILLELSRRRDALVA
jgi:GPH family glycoside/pentoside/hexuronide:cation symporter